jgi:chorismate mutase/prephenate dehydratase
VNRVGGIKGENCGARSRGHGLNLTKLESRPCPGRPFEYLFYVDFEGNVADADVQQAMEELSKLTLSLKVFGSYPARKVGG